MRRFLGHARANAIGYAALFVALGGTGYAATTTVPANSVGTPQLKNGAVTGQKVAKNTLTGANIKASTLGTVPNATHVGGLATTAFQRRVGSACSTGQAIRSIGPGGSVTCQSTGQGTITGVTAGTGLTGGATSGNASLSVDPTAVQSRVTGTCDSGSAIASINQDGSTSCQPVSQTEMGGSGSTNMENSSVDYLAPVGTSTPTTDLSSAALGSSGLSSQASNLAVSVAALPGFPDGAWTFYFVINGVPDPGGPSCEIGGAQTTCVDNADQATIPPDATVALAASPSGNPLPTTVTFGWTNTT
jgi:hypothetical protein